MISEKRDKLLCCCLFWLFVCEKRQIFVGDKEEKRLPYSLCLLGLIYFSVCFLCFYWLKTGNRCVMVFKSTGAFFIFGAELSSSVQGAVWGVSCGQPHAVCAGSELQCVGPRRDAFTAVWPKGQLPHPRAPGTLTRCPSPSCLHLRNGKKGWHCGGFKNLKFIKRKETIETTNHLFPFSWLDTPPQQKCLFSQFALKHKASSHCYVADNTPVRFDLVNPSSTSSSWPKATLGFHSNKQQTPIDHRQSYLTGLIYVTISKNKPSRQKTKTPLWN